MTKGMCTPTPPSPRVALTTSPCSVMSGIITQPHFRNYFQTPTAFQTGTMVAVLEIGAFSTSRAHLVHLHHRSLCI